MNINFEKVKEVIIRDGNGNVVDRFILSSAMLEKPSYVLTLSKAKPKENKS